MFVACQICSWGVDKCLLYNVVRNYWKEPATKEHNVKAPDPKETFENGGGGMEYMQQNNAITSIIFIITGLRTTRVMMDDVVTCRGRAGKSCHQL